MAGFVVVWISIVSLTVYIFNVERAISQVVTRKGIGVKQLKAVVARAKRFKASRSVVEHVISHCM